MPVTLTTATHPPRKWGAKKVTTTEELFQGSCEKEYKRSRGVIQSSFPLSLLSTSHISPSAHGFVWAVVDAYSNHYNLTIRPEDVWFSILTQLSFFINAHAEDLRSYFVSHEGQKELVVTSVGNINSVDLGALAVRMTELIEKNVVDEELRTWIMPDFSTTTESDNVVAAILTMGSMQKYFSYKFSLCCGIPSVTLLGERQDWLRIVKRLDKLHQLGDEPARFAQVLRPVLNHFVLSFDSPESSDVRRFWSKCAERSGGSGPSYLTGWVSAFCFWDQEGKLLYSKESMHPISSPEFDAHNTDFDLEDVLSRRVDTADIPPGYASVPVTANDNGVTHDTVMLAGLVGIQAKESGGILDQTTDVFTRARGEEPKPATQETGLDSIQPLSGWWMYEGEPKEEAEKRAHELQQINDRLSKIESLQSPSRAEWEERFELHDRRVKLSQS